MGLFSREPAEKKAYWKAFGTALSKQNEDAFASLEQASKGYSEGWEGYFLMALCYDLAVGKIPFNPEKAKEYHKLVKERGAAKNVQFVDSFYAMYDGYAGNFRVEEEYYPRAMNIRKAITGMMLCYDHTENAIVTNVAFKNDLKFWDMIFRGCDTGKMFKSSDEQNQCSNQIIPVLELLNAWNAYGAERNDRIKYASKIIKETNKLSKIKPSEMQISTQDMYGFIFGYSLMVYGGAYDIIVGENGWYKDIRINGFKQLWNSAHHGCVPSLHMLAVTYQTPELRELICFAYTQSFNNASESEGAARHLLLTYLEEAAVKGDQDAMDFIHNLAD